MIFNALRNRFRGAQPPEAPSSAPQRIPAIPDGARLYAVGDIHGRADLLETLARRIEADLKAAPVERAVTVFLGDYVDRGPHSAQVVERLATGAFPTALVALQGNHEEMFLTVLDSPEEMASWRRYGGLETMHSYGVDPSRAMRATEFDEICEALREAVPQSHLDFMAGLRHSSALGDYFFCHAGVRPGVPLAEQAAHDLKWIREDFLRASGPFERVVVHGHTPVERAEMLGHRINVDTGAFATGVLTCLVLEGTTQRLLDTRG